MRIGYARISSDAQTTAAQIDALRAANCDTIFEDRMSGARRDRPELAKALGLLKKGDVLIVYKLDRLARSVAHLLEVVEDLTKRGVAFRSINDPVDTSTPAGRFTLQILGAVAELERSLIRERTKAGVAAAKMRGRIAGNPQLRTDDGVKRVALAREATLVSRLLATADQWTPIVRRMRPQCAWGDVAAAIGPDWTAQRLERACKRAVHAGLLDPRVLHRTRRRLSGERLATIAGAFDGSLAEVAERLSKMGERTPSGGRAWSEAAVRRVLGGANV